MKGRDLTTRLWFRMAVGLVVVAAVLAGLRFMFPHDAPFATAQEPADSGPPTEEDWNNVPPGSLPALPESAFSVKLMTVGEYFGDGDDGAGGAGGTGGAGGASSTDTPATGTPTPRTSTTTNPAKGLYKFPAYIGDRHVGLLDGRVVLLPDDVEITAVATIYSCRAGGCPVAPAYLLTKTTGDVIKTVGLDANGTVFQSKTDGTHDPSAFPFLQEIWPQNPDAPGTWHP